MDFTNSQWSSYKHSNLNHIFKITRVTAWWHFHGVAALGSSPLESAWISSIFFGLLTLSQNILVGRLATLNCPWFWMWVCMEPCNGLVYHPEWILLHCDQCYVAGIGNMSRCNPDVSEAVKKCFCIYFRTFKW